MVEAELLDRFRIPVDAGRPIANPEGKGAGGLVLDRGGCCAAASVHNVPESGFIGIAELVGGERFQDAHVVQTGRGRLDGRRERALQDHGKRRLAIGIGIRERRVVRHSCRRRRRGRGRRGRSGRWRRRRYQRRRMGEERDFLGGPDRRQAFEIAVGERNDRHMRRLIRGRIDRRCCGGRPIGSGRTWVAVGNRRRYDRHRIGIAVGRRQHLGSRQRICRSDIAGRQPDASRRRGIALNGLRRDRDGLRASRDGL